MSCSSSPSLKRLVYTSRATLQSTQQSLEALLCVSRPRNHRVQVTGLLVATPQAFFQCLEGAPEAVDATMNRIRLDPRHLDIQVLLHEPIAERTFARWDMATARLRQPTWERLARAHWPLGPVSTAGASDGLGELARLAAQLG